ncbi:MAG: Maf family protein [Burkholderiales bacterium]
MTLTDSRFYLASRSPRRRELLKQIGASFDLLLLREDLRRGADVDETPHAGEAALLYVERVARQKAETGWRQVASRGLPPYPVLAADTTVIVDGEIFGKPRDTAQAIDMLGRLSGRAHQVASAVAVTRRERTELRVSVSEVVFRRLEVIEIRRYAASGEPLGKAGAYAIQGRAAAFITSIAGSYSGIVGLPLHETADLLARFDVGLL